MPFEISDAKSFEENLADFLKSLEADDPKLAAALKKKIPAILRGGEIGDAWDALDDAVKENS